MGSRSWTYRGSIILIEILPKYIRSNVINSSQTGLYWIAKKGHQETVQALVQCGADIKNISSLLRRYESLKKAVAAGLIVRALAPGCTDQIPQDQWNRLIGLAAKVQNNYKPLSDDHFENFRQNLVRIDNNTNKEVRAMLKSNDSLTNSTDIGMFLDATEGDSGETLAPTQETINFILRELGRVSI